MSPVNYGKKFEQVFKSDWKKSFPDGFIYRLNDQLSGYKVTSANVCDFICYNYPYLYLIECKSHKGASVPFEKITQYERMLQYSSIKGVIAGVVLWLYEKDIEPLFIPIRTLTKMKTDGKKSVGLKAIEEGYEIIKLPSIKKRVFYETDYTILEKYFRIED